MEENSQQKPSKLWYLLPIFLGILGGIAVYLLLQDRDKKFAKKLLIVGIIMTAVWIIIFFVLRMYMRGAIKEEQTQGIQPIDTQWLQPIDTWCHDGKISTLIRYIGTEPITVSDLKFYVDGSEELPTDCSEGIILPGGTVSCQIGSGLTAGHHYLEIVLKSQKVENPVYCT